MDRINSGPTQLHQSDIGQGMGELALVFPLLLMIILGIVEFGRNLFNYSAVVSASREVVHYWVAFQVIGGGISPY